MSQAGKRGTGNGERDELTVSLPVDIVERLRAFCREMKITPDIVVERALIEYFREGDVSH